VQGPDHGDAKRAFAIEHFGDFALATQERNEVFSCKALLVQSELDGFYRVGQFDRKVLSLIIPYELSEKSDILLLLAAIGLIHEGLEVCKRLFIVLF
jgi:hypothetical protein